MDEKIVLLSDNTWFAVYTAEQAQRIVNTHNWKDIRFKYGIYIEPSFGTFVYPNNEGAKKHEG